MFNRVKNIMRWPGGKRYVVACFISMIGGGGNCNGNRDIATCMWKLNIPDDVLKWILKIADECEFSKSDHEAAHGSEDWFEQSSKMPV